MVTAGFNCGGNCWGVRAAGVHLGLACATRGCFPLCPAVPGSLLATELRRSAAGRSQAALSHCWGYIGEDLGVTSVSCHSKTPQTKLSSSGNLLVRHGWGRPGGVLREARRGARALSSFSPLRFFATQRLPRALPRAALPCSLQPWPCWELLGQGGFCSMLRAVGSSRETCVGKA